MRALQFGVTIFVLIFPVLSVMGRNDNSIFNVLNLKSVVNKTLNFVTYTVEEINFFIDWKMRFKKSFVNQVAEEIATANVLFHKRSNDEHNLNFFNGLSTFERGIWEMSDLATDEFNRVVNGYRKVVRAKSADIDEYDQETQSTDYNEEYRDYLNYTELGYVSKVQNQGYCGSCWAFTAVAALEGQLFKKTGTLIKLSEQNLMDCNKNEESGNWGCDGGTLGRAYTFLMNNQYEINSAAKYPYKGQGNYACAYKKVNSVVKFKNINRIQSGDEEFLKTVLLEVGPLAIAIDASLESLQNYKSGVYYDPQCSTQVNHAVLLVGAGTDQYGIDYWLIKNSWGTSWGELGYLRLARNWNNHCGVTNAVLYPEIEQV